MFSAIRQRDVGTLRSLLNSATGGSANTNAAVSPSEGMAFGNGLSPPKRHESNANSSRQTGTPSHLPGSKNHTPGSATMKRSATAKRQVDVNERDQDGNCPLHLAVAIGHREIVEVLLQNPKVNVNAQDIENGYTPLHKALFAGNLVISLMILRYRSNDVDLTVRDKEGLSCLELLKLTYDQTPSDISIRNRDEEESGTDTDSNSDSSLSLNSFLEGSSSDAKSTSISDSAQDETFSSATSLWTWGSNSNYILGHRNSNDRPIPERVELTIKMPKVNLESIARHKPPITLASVSKYHMLTVAGGDVFAQGFGPGGRLGLGHEETVVIPTLVKGITESVVKVACGYDHSIALTTSGTVWTWGSNGHGQLGHTTEAGGRAAPTLKPREVITNLNKVQIVAIAASKYHSAAVSSSGLLYTWGRNLGQLGYSGPHSANGQSIQYVPGKVTHLSQIAQLAVTNHSTAVLIKQSDIYVLADFQTKKVNLPGNSLPPDITFYRSTPTAETIKVIKLSAGSHQLAAVTASGNVFLWTPPAPPTPSLSNDGPRVAAKVEAAAKQMQEEFPQAKPTKIWSSSRMSTQANDVCVGVDSSLLIKTEDGHVYTASRNPKLDSKTPNLFRFQQVPNLQNISQVFCGPSGAYAAIRLDRIPPLPEPTTATLQSDMTALLADSVNVSVQNSGMQLSSDLGELCDVLLVPGTMSWNGDRDIPRLEKNLGVPAICCILSARSSFFRALLKTCCAPGGTFPQVFESGSVVVDRFPLESHTQGKILAVQFLNVSSIDVIQGCMELTYSGVVSNDIIDSIVANKQEAKFIALLNLLQINGMPQQRRFDSIHGIACDSSFVRQSFFSLYNRISYASDLSLCKTDAVEKNGSHFSCDEFHDTVLKLANGELYAHRAILAARSPFFNALMGPDSAGWTLKKDECRLLQCFRSHSIIVVDLTHMHKEAVEIALQWSYGNEAPSKLLGKTIAPRNYSEFYDFIIDVIAVADELILEGLKRTLTEVLVDRLDLTTVVTFLQLSDTYDLIELKSTCLEYLCWNLDSCIESGLLESLSSELVGELQGLLQQKQERKFPNTRGKSSYFALVHDRVIAAEKEAKQRRREEHKKLLASGASLKIEDQGSSPVNIPTKASSRQGGSANSANSGGWAGPAFGSSFMSTSSISSAFSEPQSPHFSGSIDHADMRQSHSKADFAGAEETDRSILGEALNSAQPDGIFEIDLEEPKTSSAEPTPTTATLPKGKKSISAKEVLSSETSHGPGSPERVDRMSKVTAKSVESSLVNKDPESLNQFHFPKTWNSRLETTSKVSLHDIMKETEAASTSTSLKTVRPPLMGTAGPKNPALTATDSNSETLPIVFKAGGKSQRERKRDRKHALVEGPPATNAGPSSPPHLAWTNASATPAWATSASPASNFKAIQMEQEQTEDLKPKVSAASGTIFGQGPAARTGTGNWAEGSWKGPLSSTIFSAKTAAGSTRSPSSSTVDNNLTQKSPSPPLKSRVLISERNSSIKTEAGPSATVPAMPAATRAPTQSFAEIQKAQQKAIEAEQQKRARDKRKSLMQIQTEERALQEIQDFYLFTSAALEGEWTSLCFVAPPT